MELASQKGKTRIVLGDLNGRRVSKGKRGGYLEEWVATLEMAVEDEWIVYFCAGSK